MWAVLDDKQPLLGPDGQSQGHTTTAAAPAGLGMVVVSGRNMMGQCLKSDDFLLQGDFTGLSPDLDWTSSRIWSSPTESVGSLTDCPLGPLELAGSGESPSESIGKGGGSVKYTLVYML